MQLSLFAETELQQLEVDARYVDSVKCFTVKPAEPKRINPFIESWHYSGNMNGVKSEYCFGLFWQDKLIGAAVFAEPATKGVDTAYSDNEQLKVIELRRLCCIDNTPRNAESFFIGKMLKWLKQYSDIDIVLAYSDLAHGHSGIIYQASNFEKVGEVEPIKVIEYKGKIYHDRSLRVKYKGRLKPFAVELSNALQTGKAKWIDGSKKNIYIYRIRRR